MGGLYLLPADILTKSVRKLLQTHFIPEYHEMYLCKTSANWFIGGFMCINIFEIDEPVPLKLKLLSGVFICTVLKWLENDRKCRCQNQGL
jgi:hypothetical protein